VRWLIGEECLCAVTLGATHPQEDAPVQLFRRGDTGPAVAQVQAALVTLGLLRSAPTEPVFDQPTDWAVREFQQNRGLVVDGIVGPETYAALQAARLSLGDRLLSLAGRHYSGDDVAALQERLLELGFDTGRVDGVFGVQTECALKGFQREYGLVSDGVCGPSTLRALKQLGRLVVGGRPQQLRETEALHRSGAALAGKVVVVDPGHGAHDRGAIGHGLEEAAVAEDLGARLEGRLSAVGVRTLLTRGPDSCPSDAARAELANSARADLVVSLHVDRSASPLCHGVATYHFGTGSGATSTVGEQLASLVQREVVARTDLNDCRVHAKTWQLLRLTQMPTVRLELGHVSHPGDAARLADPAFRDTVAEALLVAIQRLYLPAHLDPPTGVLRLPDFAEL
jgi:N-acetylmuramoyl-L-alanine amidase